MNLFNYIFYRIAKGYANGVEKDIPEFAACCVVTAAQGLYLASLICCFYNVFKEKNLFVGIAFFVLIINYIFFFNVKKYKIYCEKWDNENSKIRTFRGILVALFLIAAIPTALIFGSIFYNN